MLDIETGEICFSGTNYIIKQTTTKKDFCQSELMQYVLKDESHENASIYFLSPQEIFGEKLSLRIYFDKNGEINMIGLFHLKDWKDYSLEIELEEEKKLKELLFAQLGEPPYDYIWGRISASYCPQSAGSSISIRYKNEFYQSYMNQSTDVLLKDHGKSWWKKK